MAEDGVTRKLAAILAADVVGYSRLMSADEAATLSQLSTHLDQTVKPAIELHQGRIFKTMGDGFLVEFASAVEAVECAVQIQRAMPDQVSELPEDSRVVFRMGINLGDVIIQADDVFGDGVNVAARIEALADPGGVFISHTVRDQIADKCDFPLEDLGAHEVKNIPRPVHVFRVILDPLAKPIRSLSSEPNTYRRWGIGAAALVAAAVMMVGAIQYFVPNSGKPTAEDARIAANTPSIAVLPFTNMSGDSQQEYFSDGMTEDLITDLSKISGLFVIARNTTFGYKGKSPNVKDVARKLGVRHVLEGSVRKVGDQVRINAQLIDGQTGAHLWAERYDGSYNDVFALQDKVTARIVATLAVTLTASEQANIEKKETANTDAYDAFLKGWEQYGRQTSESFAQAILHFEKAIELDPGYSRAHAALAATYWQIWKRYWHRKFGMESPHDPRFKAEEYLEQAKQDPTSLALQVSTAMLAQLGYHDEALTKGAQAVALDPNDADGYVALAGAFNLAGQPEQALPLVERAIRHNPDFPPSYLYELGLSRFGMEDYEGAAVSLGKAVALNPNDRWSIRLLIATDGHLGRKEEAAKAMKWAENNWGGLDPLSIRSITFWYPFREARDTERLVDGLHKAGMPD